MDSPPKRMTRSRAAAKVTEPAAKATKIITAAARAKSTATSSTKSTAAKRKTRADGNDEEDETPEAPVRRVRGRPKKTGEPDVEAPATRTGRIRKKVAIEEPAKEAAVVASTKTARGRPRKVAAVEEPSAPAPEPLKKTTRTRATGATKTSAAAAKPAIRKTVTFQEPDKENVEPVTKAKEPAATGLRGRPARRGATTTTTSARTTKTTTKTAEAPKKKKPLSPKKVTQVPLPKDESEDELAGESTPVKPMMKSPIKPPSSAIPASMKKDITEQPDDDDRESTLTVNLAINPPDLGAPAMGSPAKRPPASPFKDAMKSPAKRIGPITLPGSALKPGAQSATETEDGAATFKASLLQSAAKRPQSPIKAFTFTANTSNLPQQTQSAMKASLFQSPAKRAFPGMVPLTEPRRRDLPAMADTPSMKPIVMATPTRAVATRPSDKLMMEDESVEDAEELVEELFDQPIESLQFPGRLSAVLPRHADPAWKKDMGIVENVDQVEEMPAQLEPVTADQEVEEIEEVHAQAEEEVREEVQEETAEEPVPEINEITADTVVHEDTVTVAEVAITTEEAVGEPEVPEEPLAPQQSPVQAENPMYQLRDKDLDPCHDMDSESEDESAPVTATPFNKQTPKAQCNGRSAIKPRVSLSGFTPLAERFGSWSAASPLKMPLTSSGKASGLAEQPLIEVKTATPLSGNSPLVKSNFFEDEMVVREEVETDNHEESIVPPMDGEDVEEPSFADMMVTEEDVALAQEANEMSLMEPDHMEDIVNTSFDDTISEASQEYGDENEVPVDPAMLGIPAHAPITPVRPVTKAFHTTTKVPLKPADDSTPSPIKKRSFSASRTAPQRPNVSTRSATVISYSPMKDRKSLPGARSSSGDSSAPATPQPATPSKNDLWSAMGTPARTPRRDLDAGMLRGAIVYVDVHTSEGADASGIFIELLTQMGAKCPKTWSWQPNGEANNESKIGITHVVYKDGGKRTLEKVRQTNGVVQCVGVSWVLE